MIHIKADARVKREAQMIIDNMGLTLSGVINAFLRQLIRTREVRFNADDDMNPYLEEVINRSRKDVNRYKFKAMPLEDILD